MRFGFHQEREEEKRKGRKKKKRKKRRKKKKRNMQVGSAVHPDGSLAPVLVEDALSLPRHRTPGLPNAPA